MSNIWKEIRKRTWEHGRGCWEEESTQGKEVEVWGRGKKKSVDRTMAWYMYIWKGQVKIHSFIQLAHTSDNKKEIKCVEVLYKTQIIYTLKLKTNSYSLALIVGIVIPWFGDLPGCLCNTAFFVWCCHTERSDFLCGLWRAAVAWISLKP